MRSAMLLGLLVVWTIVLLPRARETVRSWRYCSRVSVRSPSPRDTVDDKYKIARLAGGQRLVVLVALMGLEARGALQLARAPFASWQPWTSPGAESIVVALGPPPGPAAHEVERGVYAAVDAGATPLDEIASHPQVAAVVDRIEGELVEAGFLLLVGAHTRTPRGAHVLRRLRKTSAGRHGDVLTALFGESRTGRVGVTDLAIFGEGFLWRIDPGVARALRIPRPTRQGTFTATASGDGGYC